MKIFVTGASGFIGSHLTRALINAGHEVLALAIPDDNLWRMQDILPRFEILCGTVQDISTIQSQLRTWRPQSCIHLAWYAEPGKYLNSRENLGSLQNSLSLLQILSECGCGQFIGAGTCAEYEIKTEMLVENDKTKPETLYAASKLSFQIIGEQIAKQFGLQFAWGRIFYLYGPQEDARRLVPSAILKLQKGEMFSATPGEQKRDYLHVTDVANAFLALAEHQATGIYNICSAEAITTKSLLNMIGDLMGRPELLAHGALPYREWEPMYICGDNNKLRDFGWQPQIELQEGLEDTITWWQNQ
jgi:UDP-glucuronate decarboxylase